jgi:hypothetical protein
LQLKIDELFAAIGVIEQSLYCSLPSRVADGRPFETIYCRQFGV